MHSTYLLNRIATRALKDLTPYEAFRGKKPNVAHLRVFGCIYHAKIESKLQKKLDDRSHLLVHLGTEPGSKAYRLLDPQTKKIVVSRDVVFDETKGWNWRHVDTEKNRVGNFTITLGTFGNHGIETEQSESKMMDPIVKEEVEEEESSASEDESEMVQDPYGPMLRRSERQSSRPKYLDDYVLIAEYEGENFY